MKLKLHLLLIALCSMVALQSCSDDDDATTVPEAVQSALSAKYPSAANAKWELKAGYYVAEYWENGKEMDAWFSTTGAWSMTETDLGTDLTQLPAAVKTAFESSTYSTWRVDDIDLYERPDDTFYLIEVETAGQPDYKLYYSPTGTLLKAAADAENDDVLPNTVIGQ